MRMLLTLGQEYMEYNNATLTYKSYEKDAYRVMWQNNRRSEPEFAHSKRTEHQKPGSTSAHRLFRMHSVCKFSIIGWNMVYYKAEFRCACSNFQYTLLPATFSKCC